MECSRRCSTERRERGPDSAASQTYPETVHQETLLPLGPQPLSSFLALVSRAPAACCAGPDAQPKWEELFKLVQT